MMCVSKLPRIVTLWFTTACYRAVEVLLISACGFSLVQEVGLFCCEQWTERFSCCLRWSGRGNGRSAISITFFISVFNVFDAIAFKLHSVKFVIQLQLFNFFFCLSVFVQDQVGMLSVRPSNTSPKIDLLLRLLSHDYVVLFQKKLAIRSLPT